MNRVMVIGGPGGGKSTFAIELAKLAGLPLYHSDCMISPFGTANEYRELIRRYDEIQIGQTWILDGIYHQPLKRAAFADTIIFVDMPLFLRFWRVLKRWVSGDIAGQTHRLVGRATLRILWELILDTRHDRRRWMRVIKHNSHRTNVSILRSDREKFAYLAALYSSDVPLETAKESTTQTFTASASHPNPSVS